MQRTLRVAIVALALALFFLLATCSPFAIVLPAHAQILYDRTLNMLLMDTADKQALLDSHNAVRRSVTPPSQGMRGLYWNTDREYDATNLAATCPTTTLQFGAKIGVAWFPPAPTQGVDAVPIATVMSTLTSGGANYTFTTNTCNGPSRDACVPYLRMVSENVWWMVCGIANCDRVPVPNQSGTSTIRTGRALVCFYSDDMSFDSQPYSTGLPCTSCAANYPTCSTSLCFAAGGIQPVGVPLPDVSVLRRMSSDTTMIVGAVLGGILAILLGIYGYCVRKWYMRGMYGNQPLQAYTEISKTPGAAASKTTLVQPSSSATAAPASPKGVAAGGGKSATEMASLGVAAAKAPAGGAVAPASTGEGQTSKPAPLAPATPRSALAAMNTPLPKNWESHRDDKGREYFYNSITGVSQWTRPT